MIGPEIVAEISSNHRGSFEIARDLIVTASRAGVHTIKLQTYDPAEMVGCPQAVAPEGPWKGLSLLELYERSHTPREWHADLFMLAKIQGLGIFSSAFSPGDVAFLESLECPRYKVASFELVDFELLEAVARTRKPVVLSTGMADETDIRRALEVMRGHAVNDLTLLVCCSAYPAPADTMNLARIPVMRRLMREYGYDYPKVGLSDHTLGTIAAATATALGATMIEKHFTDDRDNGGPDATFSAMPLELEAMAARVRMVARMMGSGKLCPSDEERHSRSMRRSLWWATSLRGGALVQPEDIRSARPGDGYPCHKRAKLIGQRVLVDVYAGEPVRGDQLSDESAIDAEL